MGTGRSDYPNQVNNVLCFPYIFKGALDVYASQINDPMKKACAQALADIAYDSNSKILVPHPMNPELRHKVPEAVSQAAIDSGVSGATCRILNKKNVSEYKFWQDHCKEKYLESAATKKEIPIESEIIASVDKETSIIEHGVLTHVGDEGYTLNKVPEINFPLTDESKIDTIKGNSFPSQALKLHHFKSLYLRGLYPARHTLEECTALFPVCTADGSVHVLVAAIDAVRGILWTASTPVTWKNSVDDRIFIRHLSFMEEVLRNKICLKSEKTSATSWVLESLTPEWYHAYEKAFHKMVPLSVEDLICHEKSFHWFAPDFRSLMNVISSHKLLKNGEQHAIIWSFMGLKIPCIWMPNIRPGQEEYCQGYIKNIINMFD
jgi:hypothetical protein